MNIIALARLSLTTNRNQRTKTLLVLLTYIKKRNEKLKNENTKRII